jgi:hypothetical protein
MLVDGVDSLSGAHLSKVVAPNSNSKLKSIQLFNPDLALSFSHVGKMSYNWRFEYEEYVLLFLTSFW